VIEIELLSIIIREINMEGQNFVLEEPLLALPSASGAAILHARKKAPRLTSLDMMRGFIMIVMACEFMLLFFSAF
jgi:hypothetical protein